MKQPEPPCYGCTERVADPNCHGYCEKYLTFDKLCREFRAEKKRIAEENRILNGIEHDRIVKAATGRMYKRKKRGE